MEPVESADPTKGAGHASFQALAKSTEIRRRARLSPQPFQSGTRPLQPTEFQAEPRRRSGRVARSFCCLTLERVGQTETGSHLSDTTSSRNFLLLISAVRAHRAMGLGQLPF